jgi:hypothetical protein
VLLLLALLLMLLLLLVLADPLGGLRSYHLGSQTAGSVNPGLA